MSSTKMFQMKRTVKFEQDNETECKRLRQWPERSRKPYRTTMDKPEMIRRGLMTPWQGPRRRDDSDEENRRQRISCERHKQHILSNYVYKDFKTEGSSGTELHYPGGMSEHRSSLSEDRSPSPCTGWWKIFVFDSNMRPQFSFPTRGQTVTSVNVGLDDDILVGTTHGLLLFDGAGRFLREIPIAPEEHKGRVMVSTCAVCRESGLVIAGVVDAKTNKAQLAISRYKGSFVFYIDSHGARLRRPCGICVGSGTRAGQCLIVDHASNSVRMYKFK